MTALIERFTLTSNTDPKQFQQLWREMVNHCCRVGLLLGASLHQNSDTEWVGYYRSTHVFKHWKPNEADLPERFQGVGSWLDGAMQIIQKEHLKIIDDALLPATGEAPVF